MEADTTAEALEAAAQPSGLDLQQVKSMLNLPDTASDVDLITSLVNLIAALQEKYDSLLTDAIQLEEKLVNRDLSDFADVISPETVEFWRARVLENRESTMAVLAQIREVATLANRAPAPVEPAAQPEQTAPAQQPARIPLMNRVHAKDRTIETVAADENPEKSQAVLIRNRAHALKHSEGISFAEAFSRAEKEFIQN